VHVIEELPFGERRKICAVCQCFINHG